MSPEQLYESIYTVIGSDRSGQGTNQRMRQQNDWARQFIFKSWTDENTETSDFAGYTRSLALCNGELIQAAISTQPGSFLAKVVASDQTYAGKVGQLYRTALGREAAANENAMADRLLEGHKSNEGKALQDLLWVLLNSNEFVTNH